MVLPDEASHSMNLYSVWRVNASVIVCAFVSTLLLTWRESKATKIICGLTTALIGFILGSSSSGGMRDFFFLNFFPNTLPFAPFLIYCLAWLGKAKKITERQTFWYSILGCCLSLQMYFSSNRVAVAKYMDNNGMEDVHKPNYVISLEIILLALFVVCGLLFACCLPLRGMQHFPRVHAMNLCMLRLAFITNPLSVSSLHFIFPFLFVKLYDDLPKEEADHTLDAAEEQEQHV